MPKPIDTLDELLRDVNRGIFAVAKTIIHHQGLSAPGMRAMGHVMESPGITVSELARERGFAKSHVSNAVESMVEAGFIEKRADPDDQRLVRLYPTRMAQEHFETMHAAVHERLTKVLAVLSDDQMRAVIEGLTILRAALRQEITSSSDRS
jgi:DNA-binding MarR family transcriptional regulator